MFSQVASVVELVGLQIDACRANVGKRGFVQNVGGYVLDGGIDDFMDKTDVPVFTRRNPRDDLAPGDFRIDNGLTATPAVIDHHDEILHIWQSVSHPGTDGTSIAEKQKKSSKNSAKQQSRRRVACSRRPAGRIT
ncbi:hypothetical protein JQ600_36190 [Bradyrhizobium sp. AUGA SZCCT0176]|nr:hypothetical protein [Bradyrhizobium sp. AUGA SZCCT0176]